MQMQMLPNFSAKAREVERPKRNNTQATLEQAESSLWLSHLRLRGREEIPALHESFVTLHAKPAAAVGGTGAVLVSCFEELPSANKAMVFRPSVLDKSEVRAIFGQAEFEREHAVLTADDDVARFPSSFVPIPVVQTPPADHIADVVRIPFRAVNLNRLA